MAINFGFGSRGASAKMFSQRAIHMPWSFGGVLRSFGSRRVMVAVRRRGKFPPAVVGVNGGGVAEGRQT